MTSNRVGSSSSLDAHLDVASVVGNEALQELRVVTARVTGSHCEVIGVLEQVVAADADEEQRLGDDIGRRRRRPVSSASGHSSNEAREVPDLLGHGDHLATLHAEQGASGEQRRTATNNDDDRGAAATIAGARAC